MSQQLAFFGLGLMGRAMTKNLVLYGNLEKPLILFNRTRQSAEEHSALIGHSRVAESFEDAIISSDIIWSCLKNDEAVEATFQRLGKIDIKGKLFVESSTITPERMNSISKQVLEAGGQFVAMPVMGEPSMANSRLLTWIAAGSAESIDRIRPYVIGIVGRALIDLSGEEFTKASLLKLLGNVLIMTTMETVAEVNVFAEKCGLGTHNMAKLMNQIFPGPPHSIYNQRMLSGEYYRNTPMVKVSSARVLTAHVLDLAKQSGASVKGYQVAVDHLKVVEEHAGGSADINGIYGVVRLESGLPYENGKDQTE